MKYEEFLATKRIVADSVGFEPGELNPMLFDFQADIVRWAIRKGRAAIFADCGLGKTPMQLEWAKQVYAETGQPVLIVAPLAVSQQTIREGKKFGIKVTRCSEGEIHLGVNITNYERLEKFSPEGLAGIVLDESSILKSFDGKFRRFVTEFASGMRFRLACTATPAPNDLIELTNHSEFLGGLRGKEIIALFFRQDGNTTHQFRLKNHARQDFWKWLASWAVALRAPSDLGYEDGDFKLPELRVHDLVVRAEKAPDGLLFPIEASTLQERRGARKASLEERVNAVAHIVNGSHQWIVWCDLNAESEALTKSIPGAVEVKGSDSQEHKESSAVQFASGDIRVLVSKPSIFGFGMNWQNCHNVAFVGLSDSYEAYYQAIRRCWRFGQPQPVDCYVVTADTEGAVVQNIKRKEVQAREMFAELVEHMRPYETLRTQTPKPLDLLVRETAQGEDWELKLGDCVTAIREVGSDSVGLSVFSPPFPGMYAYTDSPQDIGNVKDIGELLRHFEFLVPELLRITMPGRSCCIHLTQEPVFKGQDGYVGLRDFRGRVISLMESKGWIYYGEAAIDKDPQLKAIRTKDHSLLFKTLSTDSADCRMALADYLLQFKKPGKNPIPVPSGKHPRWNPDSGWITSEEWIEWAAPVWYRQNPSLPGGIRETDVLNVRAGRDPNDEKHLCPLQLGVIERAIKLWTAPRDLVFSPFAGIGSEGYAALQLNRRFLGIELKESYFRVAIENLSNAKAQLGMFDALQS